MTPHLSQHISLHLDPGRAPEREGQERRAEGRQADCRAREGPAARAWTARGWLAAHPGTAPAESPCPAWPALSPTAVPDPLALPRRAVRAWSAPLQRAAW